MDEGQKPLDTFSARELDRYKGELADYNSELVELKEDITLEEWVPHIEYVLVNILCEYLRKRIFDRDVIVIASKYKVAAGIVARKYRLNLAVHPDFPVNKIFVCRKDDIETLISAQVAISKGYLPATVLTRVTVL